MKESKNLDEIQRRLMNSEHHLGNVKFELRQSPNHDLAPVIEIYEQIDELLNKIDNMQTNICTYFREVLNA